MERLFNLPHSENLTLWDRWSNAITGWQDTFPAQLQEGWQLRVDATQKFIASIGQEPNRPFLNPNYTREDYEDDLALIEENPPAPEVDYFDEFAEAEYIARLTGQ